MLDEVKKVRGNPTLELIQREAVLQLILNVLKHQANIATIPRLPLKPWVVPPV